MWFITVFEKMDQTEQSFPKMGSSRTWGYFSDKSWALEALHENVTDMWETCYDYAILEYFDEGLIPVGIDRQFFKYDRKRNGYFEIEEPEFMKRICNFAIG